MVNFDFSDGTSPPSHNLHRRKSPRKHASTPSPPTPQPAAEQAKKKKLASNRIWNEEDELTVLKGLSISDESWVFGFVIKLKRKKKMGGCCCCSSSRRADLDNGPPYYYYPRATEERVPLSSALTISSGVVVVDTNLDTSSPDAYIPPPLPTPFDVAIGVPQILVDGEEAACVDIREVSVETANVEPSQETVDGITLGVPTTCTYKETDGKLQTEIDLESNEDIDPKKLSKDLFVPIEEEEDCPICLEEYDIENPKLLAKCEHHFHLACILEWMERSETCPVCDKEMVFDSPLD